MENKIITIYELMGLIKDGKTPYEIIYKNSKYFIDELEGYYKSEGGTSLFEHIFDNYNDYEALQEKVTIPEENDEWEDIYTLANSEEHHFMNRQNGMTQEDRRLLDSNFKILGETINQLIKNQKYLKEKLESKDE